MNYNLFLNNLWLKLLIIHYFSFYYVKNEIMKIKKKTKVRK